MQICRHWKINFCNNFLIKCFHLHYTDAYFETFNALCLSSSFSFSFALQSSPTITITSITTHQDFRPPLSNPPIAWHNRFNLQNEQMILESFKYISWIEKYLQLLLDRVGDLDKGKPSCRVGEGIIIYWVGFWL